VDAEASNVVFALIDVGDGDVTRLTIGWFRIVIDTLAESVSSPSSTTVTVAAYDPVVEKS
jgi:hypothetical protein